MAHRLTTVSSARYPEGIWTKPFYSTDGADVVLRGSTQTSGSGEYATIISDTASQKIFRAPSPPLCVPATSCAWRSPILTPAPEPDP